MNTRLFTTTLAAFALSGSIAFADEIYKWTDENGNVHYEDRPSGAPSEERLQISYSRTDSSSVEKRVQAYRDAASERDEARANREADKESAAEKRAAADAKTARCQDYRAKLKTMLESRRLYRPGENGEREYLDDSARAEARQKAEELIKENCS